jgi:HEPN domain-containing protein
MKDSNDPAAWWKRAMTDRGVAQLAFADSAEDHAPTICAICQQVCEKMLKAYLLARGGVLQRIHDLRTLGEEAAKSLPPLDDLLPALAELSADFAPSRYPSELEEGFGEAEARHAVETMERLKLMLEEHVVKQSR